MRRASLALAGVLLAFVACTSEPGPLASRSATASGAIPTPSALGNPRHAFALWPEDTPQLAAQAADRLAQGADPWRSDPSKTALVFAERVLGWPHAIAGPPRDVGEGLLDVRVSRERGGPSVNVRVAKLVSGTWWSVFNVRGPLEYDPSVTVRGSTAVLGVEQEGAASEVVTIGYGGRELTETIEGVGAVTLDLGFRPNTPGHFLILLMDERGRVFNAVGAPLPAGTFAAE